MSAGARHIASSVSPWRLAVSWLGALLLASASAYAFHFTAFAKQYAFSLLIAGFFVIVAVVLLWGALQQTLEYRRFGALALVLTGWDPAPGGLLEARVDLQAPDVRSVRVSIVASHVQLKSATGRALELARSTQDVPVRGGVAEIRMRVPKPGTHEDCRWRLELHAELPGVDLNRAFPLPLGASAASVAADAPAADASRAAQLSYAGVPVLVLANLVPVAGVLLWNWRLGDLVMLYWLENLVIGAINVLRITRAGGDGVPLFDKLPLALFFGAHYGFFCFVHGMFLVEMFWEGGAGGGKATLEDALLEMLREPWLLVAVLAFAASHGYSYVRNYIGREEYRNAKPNKVMFRPYGRIVLVHVFVLVGGFLLYAVRSPEAALALFAAMKAAVDLAMHLRERKLLAAR